MMTRSRWNRLRLRKMGPEKIGRLGLVCCLMIAVLPVLASDDLLRLELSNGHEVEIKRFRGGSSTTILWLPSERGFSAAHQFHGAALAGLGHEVWLADLHSTYFVQPGHGSIAQFPLDDIVALIEAAVAESSGRVLLLSSSRGAQSALIAAREWQLRNPGNSSIAGVVLLHAHLYSARPAPGESARYLPIVQATNLPVFLLAAQYSTKASRLGELATALGVGGSRVYSQLLAGVQGGFYTREAALNSDRDEAAKLAFAANMDRAASVLTRVKPPAAAVVTSLDTRQLGLTSRAEPVLTAVTSALAAPPLSLTDLDGHPFKLEDHAGRIVLVNFWASWCRPCVTEIPSLHRLDATLADDDFRIVTVNVGEDRERVAEFLQQVPVELPVLMDYDASTSKDWMIYVYPSSYLVDHQGKIRYAYLGALEWDSIENLKIVRSLLSKR
jgi:thiol-disulfide isomerase/thioredoxin